MLLRNKDKRVLISFIYLDQRQVVCYDVCFYTNDFYDKLDQRIPKEMTGQAIDWLIQHYSGQKIFQLTIEEY